MREITTNVNIIDGKLCKLVDVDVEFIAVNAFAKIDTPLNPER